MSKKRILMVFIVVPAFFLISAMHCMPQREYKDLGENEQGQKVREVKEWRNEMAKDRDYHYPDRTLIEIWDPVTEEWYEGEWIDPNDHSKGLRLIGPEQIRRKANVQRMKGGGGDKH